LNVSRTFGDTFGDTDGDGDIDKLYSAGARSFTIWTTDASQVFDSGDDFEQITAATYPANFNASNTNNTLDDRSDDKGPEPTTVVVGAVGLRKYAFVSVDRTGGIMAYDVTTPSAPSFVQYINTRNFSQTPGAGMGGDLHPENLVFVTAQDSPTGKLLLVVSYQVSGSVRIFEISQPHAAVAAVKAAVAESDENRISWQSRINQSADYQRLPLMRRQHRVNYAEVVDQVFRIPSRDFHPIELDFSDGDNSHEALFVRRAASAARSTGAGYHLETR
jgi:hypothetical protein